MTIPIAATGRELQRSNRHAASRETGIWKDYAKTKVELAAALLRERELLREKSALLQRQYVGAGVRAPAPQQLASDRQPAVIAKPRCHNGRSRRPIEYRGRACGGVWTRASTLASPRSSEERWVQAISPALWTRAETRRNAVDRKPNSSATSRADVRRKDGVCSVDAILLEADGRGSFTFTFSSSRGELSGRVNVGTEGPPDRRSTADKDQPGSSQEGSSFNVRLQSGFRCIPTGKGRRQVGDDEV